MLVRSATIELPASNEDLLSSFWKIMGLQKPKLFLFYVHIPHSQVNVNVYRKR